MKHHVGYACINTSISATLSKTCRLHLCTEERLRSLIYSNLSGLKEILEWNYKHNIFLFRISSAVIPFASHEINTVKWRKENKNQLVDIGNFIKTKQMRVSMHPGQYVNINSPNKDVVKSSVKELEWHAGFLDSLELNSTHRLIIHAGGIYGNKPEGIKRFINVYNDLPENIRARLSLENDDRSYNIWDVLDISEKTGIPVVFDNLHHKINNSGKKTDEDIESILKLCFSTWNEKTGIPKIHFSTQKQGGRFGAHADSINIDDFLEFYFKFNKYDFDIMFETKDKERSVLEALKRLKSDGFRN